MRFGVALALSLALIAPAPPSFAQKYENSTGYQIVVPVGPGGGTSPPSVVVTPITVVPGASTAAEASHVVKGSAGTLYGGVVTTGAVGGYVMIFNATTPPADGAVTPLKCYVAPASQSTSFSADPGAGGWTFGTGIVFVFSSTGCFTKTASATAYFGWQAQ